jgi:phosphoribosylglycinamide formyltransferase 1
MPAAPRTPSPLPAVVLISGRGSNLQAILDRIAAGRLPLELRAVIADREQAAGLIRARAAAVATRVMRTEDLDRGSYGEALRSAIDAYGAKLVILAGFMRILSSAFVQHYRGRMLNVHPSLLPKYRGLHTHRRALEAGERMHGCSVHFVTEELDGGPVIAQAAVPVMPDDDEATLRARVQQREHILYPQVIGWFAAGRLALAGNQAVLDGKALDVPKLLAWGADEIA